VQLHIKYQASDGIVEEHWPGTLESARETAKEWIEDGKASWVEIRDANGQLAARFPRTLHASGSLAAQSPESAD